MTLLANTAYGQDSAEEEATAAQLAPATAPATVAAPVEKADAAPKTPEEKRLAELLKIKIDRSPASIIAAQTKLAGALPAEIPEAERLRLDAVAGRWSILGAFLKTLPAKDAARVYEHLLGELNSEPKSASEQGRRVEGPAMSPTLRQQEIVDLADIAPAELSEEQLKLLAALLARAAGDDTFLEPLMQRLRAGSAHLGGGEPTKRARAADLLLHAGREIEAAEFLPPLDAARPTASFPLLEKHVRCRLAQGRASEKKELLQQAWQLNETLLAAADCPLEFWTRAWERGLGIAPTLSEALATDWLKRSLAHPKDGMPSLSIIVTGAAGARTNRDPGARRGTLQVQRGVAEALLADSARRTHWQPALNLFAAHWIEEADYARRFHQPAREQRVLFDENGNQVSANQPANRQTNQNQLPPIPLPEVMAAAPGKDWLAALDPSLLPRALTSLAESHLRLEEDAKALPFIEQLAPFKPKETRDLANQLLGTWSSVRDPQRDVPRQRMPFYRMYGQQPQGVPLTRALQQRHLEELSALLARLRKLPIAALDNDAVATAFAAAHSPAEVFRKESLELVLGRLDSIAPATLSAVLQEMRTRLASQWRKQPVQQQAKTQRTDAQIDAEVLRGYETLSGLVSEASARQPDDWRLHLTQACTAFDWAEFQYGKKVDLAIYVEKRERAFGAFQHAAGLYAKALPAMERSGETPVIFQQWLNANLGASDLAFVTRQQEPNAKSLLRIRESILALPGEAATRHLDALAKAIAEEPGSLPAHLKPAYLRAALAVVGERETAAEIRRLVEYYDGLLREIEVNVRVDGDATVGHGRPFGAFLTVRHTAELERENAGGFGKYLRNQSQMGYYFNPYGTPPIDHRDNLEKQIREKLGEGFEVLSVTFHDEKVESRGYGRDGWRETPLAYLLLRAKNASVDRLPALRLDVDFIDKHGQVVLPVESAVQLIDARPDVPPARPVAGLEIVQMLDDRALGEGKLTLEIKATAKGLAPEFKELFEFAPAEFKIDDLTDGGPAVLLFDSAGEELAGATERNWVIKLSAKRAASRTAQFQFPRLKQETAKVAYKRYQDADLVDVPPDVALTGFPLRPERAWLWALLGGLVVAIPGWLLLRVRDRKTHATAEAAYTLPANSTPFATLQLLRKMHGDERLKLSADQRAELAQAIAGIEGHYFARQNGTPPPDLSAIGRDWISRTKSVSV